MALTKFNARMGDLDTIYVDDFGAVGDGVTDDTVAIQAALDAAFQSTASADSIAGLTSYRGTSRIVFGCRKAYKISSTLNFGTRQFLADPDGTGNFYGCNVNVDFNGSKILPTSTASPAIQLWGDAAQYENLTIDFEVYCTRQQVHDNELVGIRMTPSTAVELNEGNPGNIDTVYKNIRIYTCWRGFECDEGLNYTYRVRFENCEVSPADWGFYLNMDAFTGDGTSNAFQQCHVRAGDFKNAVSNGGNFYVCHRHHVSSAATEPGVGADWQDYWVQRTWLTGGLSYPAWTTSTFYGGTGKGYYMRAGALVSFTGHNSCDGVIATRFNPAPVMQFGGQGVSIAGGFHLEDDWVIDADVPMVAFNTGDAQVESVYLARCVFNAAAPVFGSLIDPCVEHPAGSGTYYQVSANHSASSTTEPGVGASWATVWTLLGAAPKYAGAWEDGKIYRLLADGRNIVLDNITYKNTGEPDAGRLYCDMDRMTNVDLGMGYFGSFISGTPTGRSWIRRNEVSYSQYKAQAATGGGNCVFEPTANEIGTLYTFNSASGNYMEMQLGGAVALALPAGAYFELQCYNSSGGGGSYTATAPESRVTTTGTNIHGPTVAKNGNVLCVQKAYGSVFKTWIKSGTAYGTGINRVNNTVNFDEFAKANLPAASAFKGYMVMVTDEVGGYTPAFSDGTNWRRVADRAIVS